MTEGKDKDPIALSQQLYIRSVLSLVELESSSLEARIETPEQVFFVPRQFVCRENVNYQYVKTGQSVCTFFFY